MSSRSVLSCYGILPSLFYERAAGTALREAGRQTHANSAVPIAQLVAAQLSEALDESITLTLPRATDVATFLGLSGVWSLPASRSVRRAQSSGSRRVG